MIIHPQLIKILKERGLTQTALVNKGGVAQSKISNFDNKQSHKDIDLFLIAKSLNLHIEDLFEVIDD